MKKIPTMFVRDPDERRYITTEVTPGCEWVLAGEGKATRKFDGTCVLVRRDGLAVKVWARRQIKEGADHPAGFVPIEFDEETCKLVGWEPAEQSAFAKWIAEALSNMAEVNEDPIPGTYELVGPKVNQNPEDYTEHWLVPHGADDVPLVGRDYETLKNTLAQLPWEGIVFHHSDGRKAKIKRKDFR